MRLSPASATSSSKKESRASNLSGPRLRKKHKRLDAICEEEYTRNHGDLSAGSGAGPASTDLELRRSSRVRRPPVLLDVSPSPPRKRRRIEKKKVTLSADRNVKSSSAVSRNVEDPGTTGSWRSRLRSRGRNVGFEVKEERDCKNEETVFPNEKRKSVEEIGGGRKEEKALRRELVDVKSELEVGKSMVVKSKRPGRIKATNDSKSEEKDNELHVNNDEIMREDESDVIGNKSKEDNELYADTDEVRGEESEVIGDKGKEAVLELDCEMGVDIEKKTADGNAPEIVNTEECLQLEDRCDCNEAIENLEGMEHVDEQVEQIDSIVEGDNQTDVVDIVSNSAKEVEEHIECYDGKDAKLAELDEKPQMNENNLKMDKSICASSDRLHKSHVKEGRRCGLCGGGTDGKPPKKLALDTGESDNEDYSGSSASEEPNYDIWDGFGDEPGWLGRLLGPINDRYGIAGIWVHQHCAVWSPEVYFAGLGCLKNVRAALCRGRALKCTRCGRPGATIGCRVDRCPKTYHLPCARANSCIFDHRKFLIACTDHRHLFQPYGNQYFAMIKKMKARKVKLELRKLSNDACRKDIEAEEKWLENCGEDEEFLKRESKRLHRDLVRIAPVYIGGSDSESGKSFQGWESVAGLQDVIRCLKEVVILPLLYPEFFDNLGLTPPRGVLLHGYPGTGKTLVVRALIGACARGDKRIAYFARKGADCLGKYVGDAERQLRLLFQVAEKCQPSIIFFDEIDGLAPCRTRQQDQTHSSVVSTLLALLDGLKSRGSVVVIGATNRPDAVDPALRRPGRFDREIYFPLPSVKDRAAILSLHTERWPKPVSGSLLKWIASKTTGYAGADLQALCTQAAITALKRNFPLQEILLTAGERASCGKRIPLPNFTVEERDWLEALSCSSPPCSRREAGIAANDIVSSPLPTHLIPCLLQPLSTLLVSLHLDERVWLPTTLSRSGSMIKSVIVSALEKKKMPTNHWWTYVDDFIQEADVAKEIERNLLFFGIFLGDANLAGSQNFDDDTDVNIVKFEPSQKLHGGSHANLLQYMSSPSRNKSGFRVVIAGSPRSGQRHLASCLIHCFVGNVEIQKVDLATISQEGHGDVVQGITQILMKCAAVGSCMVFMPRIDLWAVETSHQVIEESESCSTSHQYPEDNNSSVSHGQAVEDENASGQQKCKSAEMAGDHDFVQSASHAWSFFIEQVESICVSTSLMILATSEVPLSVLPVKVRQFFKREISNGCQSTPMENTVPRFSVKIDADFNHDSVINRSAAELSWDVVQQLVQLMHRGSHIHTSPYEKHKTCDLSEGDTVMVNHVVRHGSDGLGDNRTQFHDESVVKVPPPPNNRTVKGRSSLLLAISSFGYQILRYPHFSELCWVTSKLKEGPAADVSGPWKGWPFNSCIIRPNNLSEKVAVGCSSGNVKSKEKSGLVRGLIAVGLSAYRGVYTSLREVSFEVRKVLELLVAQINSKVQAGKDRYQYLRLLSQVAYLEDMVNSWAYTLQSLEPDASVIVANSKLNVVRMPDNHHEDSQVQCEECKPDVSSKSSEPEVLEERPHGFAAEKIQCIDLNKEDGDLSYPNSQGGVAVSDRSPPKTVLANHSTLEKSLQNLECDNQLVINILKKQNGTASGPCEPENGRNDAMVNGESGLLRNSNGFASTDCAVISDSGINSGELTGVKYSNTRTISNQIHCLPETADAGSPDVDENIVDANIPSSKTAKPSILCLYRCCSECLGTLHHLTQKILIHEWGLNRRNWTVEDVHDIVASLSMDLISAIRRAYVTGNFSNPVNENLRHGNEEKLYECPELKTCLCKNLGNDTFVPVECSCHSLCHSLTTEANTSPSTELRFDLKFFFRDGVLVHIDPDRDVSFHCKFETLCLCSLIELIVMTKKPFD
ncbi:uncharacterized protein LOC107432546 [Ziziphus jujuba]|uniref:Uncharacterized protein LOC107432546 n=1 Tax=Ziziphus jujuba TaxID=326968 RepID=A0A6P6GMW8_ZIZJJ|nr:uncharacterized protein LOC107432546 [Ziziphus jujuba]XP_024935442.2 uncharacterized protein LOC107432546 [Ziziphus jujuba]